MKLQLTAEQRKALEGHTDDPIIIEDTKSRRRYVLVLEDQYERGTVNKSHGDTVAEMSSLQDDVALADGWNNPALDVYADYDQHRRSA